jgi:hypothetical protein
MPWSRQPDRTRPGVEPAAIPSRSGQASPDLVTEILDPVLVPLGFAPGQVGDVGEPRQVIFCRGEIDSADGGCVDLGILVLLQDPTLGLRFDDV